jgi:hypothetical protein
LPEWQAARSENLNRAQGLPDWQAARSDNLSRSQRLLSAAEFNVRIMVA